MRSRTRNCPLLLAVLICIGASALIGEDYRIGYRFSTQNAQVFHETLSVSKSMTPCSTIKTQNSILLPRKQNELLKTTLRYNEEAFLTFVSHYALNIQSHQAFNSYTHSSSETLTLPTHCYAVEFNDETATITLLE